MSLVSTLDTLSKLFPLAVLGIVATMIAVLSRTFRPGASYWEQFLPVSQDTPKLRHRKVVNRLKAFARVASYFFLAALAGLLQLVWLVKGGSSPAVLYWLFLLTFPPLAAIVYGALAFNAASVLVRWMQTAQTFRRHILGRQPARPTTPPAQPAKQVAYLALGMAGIVLSVSWYQVHYPWLLIIYAASLLLLSSLFAGLATRGKRSTDTR